MRCTATAGSVNADERLNLTASAGLVYADDHLNFNATAEDAEDAEVRGGLHESESGAATTQQWIRMSLSTPPVLVRASLAVFGFIALPLAAHAQQSMGRLSFDAHLAVPLIAGNSMRQGNVGGGVGVSYSITRRIELVADADAIAKPRPQVCTADFSACDLRFLRGVGTLAIRGVFRPDATAAPYLAAGGYITRWDGSYRHAFGPTDDVSGSGPSGAMAALGIRMSGSPRSRFFGRLEYAALFDVAGGTGGVLRFGAGWRL